MAVIIRFAQSWSSPSHLPRLSLLSCIYHIIPPSACYHIPLFVELCSHLPCPILLPCFILCFNSTPGHISYCMASFHHPHPWFNEVHPGPPRANPPPLVVHRCHLHPYPLPRQMALLRINQVQNVEHGGEMATPVLLSVVKLNHVQAMVVEEDEAGVVVVDNPMPKGGQRLAMRILHQN